MHRRLEKIEQHPAMLEARRREHCKRLLSLPRKELFAKIDQMDAAELDELEAFIGPCPELEGIDLNGVPEVALDAFLDGELTLGELRERYPAHEVQP